MSRTVGFIAAILGGVLTVADPSAAQSIRVAGIGSGTRTIEVFAEIVRKDHPSLAVVVTPGLGSRGGRMALIAGAIDLAISAEPISAEDRAQGLIGVEVARTPFVFATGRQSSVSGLTSAEAVEIYAGRMTTWPDGSRIRLILRPNGDSDTAGLRVMSPAMARAVEMAHALPGMKMVATDQDAADAIQTIAGGFGTTTLALVLSESRPLKVLALDGAVPSPQALADGTYHHFKGLYLVTRGKLADGAQGLLTLMASLQGRQTLTRLGCWPAPLSGSP